jgi:hypothetical protein
MSAPIVQFAMMMYAGKNMVDGISEGNILKSVMNGITMASIASGLGTESANAAAAGSATAATTNSLGTAAASNAAEATISGGVTSGTISATGTSAADLGLSSVSDGGTVASGVTPATSLAGAESAKDGWLSGVSEWAKDNPQVASGILQIGGGILQGHAQEELLKDKWDREERLEAESRARRGYSAGTGILGQTRYNPKTGYWEYASTGTKTDSQQIPAGYRP